MCLALMLFLDEHPQIKMTAQKFGTSGHSPIQEVDSIHSHIERHLKNREVFSPVSLIRKLTRMKYKGQPLVVIQLRMINFVIFRQFSRK